MEISVHYSPGKSKLNWFKESSLFFVCYMSFSAFMIYSCMYGFRKPYTVGTYSDMFFLGISYKVCLVIAQVLGYMSSKFIGIRYISSMKPVSRARNILVCIGLAWCSLFLFAIVPAPYNILCMFINGLPLGMVYGLVFGFLEGRKTTEIMGAFLATSFIFASGLAKTIGKYLLMQFHISDWWMPFAAGAIFLVPLLVSVWMIQQSPPPSEQDVLHRTVRNPMVAGERKRFIQQFGLAITPVILAYSIFTIVRDFTEDFANELWMETGYHNNAAIFTQASTLISLFVLFIVGSFFLIKNNFTAFKLTHYLVMFGVSISSMATLLFHFHLCTPFVWILSSTAGLYLGYLPFNCLYFERMLSAYKIRGNVGFVMYIADAFGYLGTVIVLLIKEFISIKYNWVHFFSFLFYGAGVAGVVLVSMSVFIHQKTFKQYK